MFHFLNEYRVLCEVSVVNNQRHSGSIWKASPWERSRPATSTSTSSVIWTPLAFKQISRISYKFHKIRWWEKGITTLQRITHGIVGAHNPRLFSWWNKRDHTFKNYSASDTLQWNSKELEIILPDVRFKNFDMMGSWAQTSLLCNSLKTRQSSLMDCLINFQNVYNEKLGSYSATNCIVICWRYQKVR